MYYLVALFLLLATPAFAQSDVTLMAAASHETAALDGSPAPVAPEVITRDAQGRATIRAIRLSTPIRVDGRLDDEVYLLNKSFGNFVQAAPDYGDESTERTEVWIAFDDDHIYVSARCWDTAPPDQWLSNALRRDGDQVRDNDHFGVMFDTYYDRRSGFIFYTNLQGALADYTVVDEGGPNKDWNPVWESRTARFDGGWTVEMAIPFKTLRYRSGPNQTWGVQLRRAIRHKNEWTYLTPVPRQMAGPQAFNRISAAGTLVGLDLPPASRNLELKPYVISSLTTDRTVVPTVRNDITGDIGGDIKYGVSANLTADFTFNTDFAQVEVDEQQVNLTRFSLFFPEKREFFLEGRGVFDFGRGGGGGFGGGGGGGGDFGGGSEVPSLFYSRRIGFSSGRVIPITAGGRLTGKAGAYSIGVVNIQTGDDSVSRTPDTNFTVLRVKRDLLRRSNVGAMFTNRSASLKGPGSNQAYGVDASFSFYETVNFGGYYARTATPGLTGSDDSYQAKFDYNADRYGARVDLLKVGDNFNPEVGFLRRDDFRRVFSNLRFSPRPAVINRVRKYSYEAQMEYIESLGGLPESRRQQGSFNVEFNNSDRFNVEVSRNYEFLERPFTVAPSVTIPVGGYWFNEVQGWYSFGSQRLISGGISVTRGQFYDGDITSIGFNRGRVSLTDRLALEPSVAISKVNLPHGNFTTAVLRSRADYGFSPRMFASALVQYNRIDHTFSSNLRFRWEYRPGSEFFVVWTDERDTWDRQRGGIGLRNRAFVVKVTRLLQF